MLGSQYANFDKGSSPSPVLVVTLLAVFSLIAYHASALWTWLRAAWILRKLPNGSGNLIYGGLSKVLSFNRMREVQKVNESVLHGAGACFFNVLWRQVSAVSMKTESITSNVAYRPGQPFEKEDNKRLTCLQIVVVTDPGLIAQLLHDKSLHKPVEPDYAHFRQVQ